ncbi:restriction endonuclease subunit S [Vibrio sp. 11986-1-5]|uniref:restriction endonuclease subunit S n=1 Tax=Vibrio sp. 11986-1-5 TaxID=2211215 RepID=UPI00215A73DA|nr:restriction endonuclease subunit S [Vibrio sp. 11986-1-5]
MSEIEKLPMGWCKANLENVCELIRGISFSSSDKSLEPGSGLIACLRTANVQQEVEWGNLWYIPEGFVKREEQLIKKEDILISNANSYELVGKVSRINHVPHKATLGAFISILRPERIISKGYLYYAMLSEDVRTSIRELSSTTTNISNVSISKLKTVQIKVAPCNEQLRIVEKIEELFSELDAGVKELKAAQTKLSQYRQSLLKSAVEGSLTQQWRVENSDQVQETGEQLLARILKQRREQWQQQKLAEFAEKGKTPPKNWQDKYPEPVQPDTTNLPELPEGWVWASLSQIGWLDRGKSKHRPRNAEHLYGGVYPFVQTGEIRSAEQYIRHTEKTYSEEGLKQSKLWPKGTMCITIAANIGETAILDIDACFPDSIVGFSTIVDDMPIEYVEYVFRVLKHKLDDEAPATAQKNINLEILYKEAIPLPPVIEQLAIAEYLNTELDNIKLQKTATALGLKQSEAQRKNILKSAFSGQLVPQDPNDEPASVLLEKIKQEREALAQIPKPRKPSKPKKKVDLMNTLLEVLTAENDWIDAQDAFQKCGIVDGTSTDRIEEIYTELRKLEKAGKIQIQRQGDFDQLKLIKQDVKED